MTPVALKQGAKGVLVSTYYTILKKKSSKLDIFSIWVTSQSNFHLASRSGN